VNGYGEDEEKKRKSKDKKINGDSRKLVETIGEVILNGNIWVG